MARLRDLKLSNGGLTIADLSVLIMAEDNHAFLLANEKLLRNLAYSKRVPCHGAIWLLDQMIQEGLVKKRRRTYILRNMELENVNESSRGKSH